MSAFMPLRPILSSLSRHKLTAALLALEVAFTCAIVCNVAFLISGRLSQMQLPSGLDEAALTMVDSVSVDDNEDRLARNSADLTLLRTIPGVTGAAVVDTLPLFNSNWTNVVSTDSESTINIPASAFDGTPGELGVLGLTLLEGRDFTFDEYRPVDSAKGYTGLGNVPSTIISRALAKKLYPDSDALGKDLYVGVDHPLRIVGVVDHLLKPSLGEPASNELSMLFPMLPDEGRVTYVLHSAAADRERVLAAAQEVLKAVSSGRVLQNARSFTQLRAHYFQRDQTMIGLLISAAVGLLFVTALGIAGLASFWVQQRYRQIGIRRALGATRRDILGYFQTENFIIVSCGIGLGMTLAYGLNLWLIQRYELPRMPSSYFVIGALSLWLLGQFAVLGPALRASRVSPVVATRTA